MGLKSFVGIMAGPGQHYPMPSRGSLPGPQMMTSQPSMGGYMPPASQMGPLSAPGPGPAGIHHQQSFPGPGPSTAQIPHSQPMTSPTKPVNAVSLCKRGQETNQELMNKVLEVFRQFRQLQLPNGTNNQIFQEKRVKIEEGLKYLTMNFKTLRLLYDKVNELVPEPDEPAEEVLISVKGDPCEAKNTNTEAYKHISEEHKQIIEQIHQRNQQIKEIIDKIRTIMWEINTMIVMRKT